MFVRKQFRVRAAAISCSGKNEARRQIARGSMESNARQAAPFVFDNATYAVKLIPFSFGEDFVHAPFSLPRGGHL